MSKGQSGDNSGKVLRKEAFFPRGFGAESNSIQLKVHKEELERGVFITSNKGPILRGNNLTVGPNPIPFTHFQNTGLIP